MSAEREALIADLSRPDAYPGAAHAVERRETHISHLFFVDDRVYKVKKDVRFAFLDFSTPELRRRFAEEELALNRRLTPWMYLGLSEIRRDARGRHRVDGPASDGPVVEVAVRMRRLPADRMLDRLLERGAIDNELCERLARALADFHAAADAGPAIARYGELAAIERNVAGNVSELAPFVAGAGPGPAALSPRLHAFLLERARAFLASNADLIARRAALGRVKDGHGDLHAENVCALEDGRLAIYDCLEFSVALRAGDVACDLAFLAMDLDLRGFPGFSGLLVRRYAELAGDGELEALLPFYKSYRALVRAKVTLLGAAGSPDADARARAARKAAAYVHLAAGYDLVPPVLLVEGDARGARPLALAFRARVLDAQGRGAGLDDLARTLAAERAAVIVLAPAAARLEPALLDAATRTGRALVRADGAASDPVADVIERLIDARERPTDRAS